jgi:hypothetical protein
MQDKKPPLKLSPLKEGVIAVDEWQPDDEDNIVGYAGKSMIIPFDKLIDKINTDALNIFFVSHKDSYCKQFPSIARYINYFLKFYDTDHELIMNYLHCKFMIDSRKTNPSRKAMIDMIYKYFVTPTMYDKVKRFVHDNYRIDLSQNKEAGKEYSESLEFTNKHAEILMLISTFIKFLIPLVMHYISVVKGRPEVKNLIYYYRPLFDLTYEIEDVNIYVKLFHSILVKVNFNETNNPAIWAKYEVNSVDTISYAEELLDKNLIVDNVFKYNFYQSIISFNSVIIKTQLEYRCIKNFGINMQEISTEKDSDGLSYLDKLEMDMVKIDENNILLSKVNIKDTIKRIKKQTRIKISKEEREFYIKNTKISKIGKTLVFYYYSKLFGGFTDLNNIVLKKYMDLMILMKRRLEYNGYLYIPQIISAKVLGRANNRLSHSQKHLERIEKTPTYMNLEKEKYPSLSVTEEDRKKHRNMILGPLQTIEMTMFGFVDYDEPDKTGKIIKFDYDILKQEFNDFINSI